MDLNLFYVDVLTALDRRNVEILLVGGFAVGFHGYAHYTKDLDLWINPTEDNLKRLGLAIQDLKYSQNAYDEIIKTRPINHPTPIRLFSDDSGFYVDLMTTIYHNFTFEQCFKKANQYQLDGFKLPVIDILDLIEIKENTKRYNENFKDLIDAKELRKIYEARISMKLEKEPNILKKFFSKIKGKFKDK